MYVSPRHPDYDRLTRRRTPPEPDGLRLATLDRGDGRELRVDLATYHSHPFVRLQLWASDDRGRLWPVKGRSVSIRVRELGEVIGALRSLEDLVDRPAPEATAAEGQPVYVERRRRPGRFDPRDVQDMPAPRGGDRFSEFQE